MEFIISYEDLKKVLGAFYSSTYAHVVPYVEILHKLKEKDGKLTLIERLELEKKATAEVAQAKEKQDGQNGDN